MEKHYPEFMTQIVVGSICYVFAYFILRDTINMEEYSSYFIFLAIIDTAYLVYQKKFNTVSQEIPEYSIQTVQNLSIPMDETTQTDSAQTETMEVSDNSIELSESSNHLFSIESEKSQNS